MKTATILSTFAAVLPAFAAPAKRATPPTVFGGLATHSGSAIHLSEVAANGREFWIGKPTSSYCPSDVVTECPAGNYTVFNGGSNTLGLSTEVPGGQTVFVAADGSLGYTGPHSADTGVNSTTTGFSTTFESGHLTFENNDFLACGSNGTYQVYAASRVSNSSCIGFGFYLVESTAPGAWEYI